MFIVLLCYSLQDGGVNRQVFAGEGTLVQRGWGTTPMETTGLGLRKRMDISTEEQERKMCIASLCYSLQDCDGNRQTVCWGRKHSDDGEHHRWKQRAVGYGSEWISRPQRSSSPMVEGVVSN